MFRYAILFSMLFLVSCASADLHKQSPCENIKGEAGAECLMYTSEEGLNTAGETRPVDYNRMLQGIDHYLHGAIDYLFY